MFDEAVGSQRGGRGFFHFQEVRMRTSSSDFKQSLSRFTKRELATQRVRLVVPAWIMAKEEEDRTRCREELARRRQQIA